MKKEKSTITLKKATVKDAEKILRFMKDYYALEGLEFVKRDSQNALIGLLNKDTYGFVYLIHVDGTTVGYACLTFGYSLEHKGRDCILDEIYVIPEYRRKGIGSEVLERIEQQLQGSGFKALHLEVYDKNKSARIFFVHNGFTVHSSSFMSKIL